MAYLLLIEAAQAAPVKNVECPLFASIVFRTSRTGTEIPDVIEKVEGDNGDKALLWVYRTRQEGYWKDGVLVKQGIRTEWRRTPLTPVWDYYCNFEVECKAGLYHGKGTFWNTGGNRSEEGLFVNGMRNGTWVLWSKDGMRREVIFKDGQRVGDGEK